MLNEVVAGRETLPPVAPPSDLKAREPPSAVVEKPEPSSSDVAKPEPPLSSSPSPTPSSTPRSRSRSPPNASSPDSRRECLSDDSTKTAVYDPGTPDRRCKEEKEEEDATENSIDKKTFFRSESSSCESRSSWSSDGGFRRRRGRGRRRNIGVKVEKKGEESEDEIKEMKKLLRLGVINTPRNEDSSSERDEDQDECKDKNKEEEEGEEGEVEIQEELRKKVKLKTLQVNLMDCLETRNSGGEASESESEEERRSETDFLSAANSQIKAAFLLTSSEEEQEENEKEKEEKGEKKIVTKKAVNTSRSKRNDYFNKISDDSSSEEILEMEVDNSTQSSSKNRKEKPSGPDSDPEIPVITVKSEFSPTKGRKNIKKILKKDSLHVETKEALKNEEARKKRLEERRKLFKEIFPEEKEDELILDFDPETKEVLVSVHKKLVKKLKPHQKEGVKFMWDNCFESLKRLEEDSGSGCILAHCMGLGKTLQVVTLVHTLLTQDTGVRTVLVLCPLNTVENWIQEFKVWLKGCRKDLQTFNIIPHRNNKERVSRVKFWASGGGVLIVSYEMFRSLIKKETQVGLTDSLLNPGPDLIVCDEGHVLKNKNSALSRSINRVKTLRRIILTGTPLQNNLIEYYCMVQFVKPNILGTKKEFCNRFVNPINNGQFEDSTQADVRRMKRRAHVLHTMLEGFIQRFGYYVLTPFLPEKQEYVISVALTETQEKVYRSSTEWCLKEGKGLFKDFHWIQKIWTHPRVMLKYAEKINLPPDEVMPFWKEHFREEEYEDIWSGGKLILLFRILQKCDQIGEKVLVFSQSLCSLDLIEHFLWKSNQERQKGLKTEFAGSWVLGQDYFRLDGSTSSDNRYTYCQKFNKNERCRLFLISTKAGGLGINLVAANRVVLFDASWNPSHDVQSIFRVYRFGQTKPCFIYRFLASATMEEKIYKRQVTKLSLAHRILDEHQIERHYTMGNLQELYTFEPIPRSEWRVPKVPKDPVFADILSVSRDIIVGYHEHDSLLENKEDEELTEEERQAAWEDFEKEKLTPGVPTSPPKNGVVSPVFLERLNSEGSRVVHNYKNSLPDHRPDHFLVVNEPRNQICRITEVRTLMAPRGGEEVERWAIVNRLGKATGLYPYDHESNESYCQRVEKALRTAHSWNGGSHNGA